MSTPLLKLPKSTRIHLESQRWLLNGREVSLHQRISNNGLMQLGHYLVLEFILHPEDSVERVYRLRTRNEVGELKVFVREQYKHNPRLFAKTYKQLN